MHVVCVHTCAHTHTHTHTHTHRPVFHPGGNRLDLTAEFSPLHKQERERLGKRGPSEDTVRVQEVREGGEGGRGRGRKGGREGGREGGKVREREGGRERGGGEG